MYPHERSLVKRLEDKPFVLLGVNSDEDKAKLREAMAKENITWRSWWDGGSTSGPIASRWNVFGWPTLYLIDAQGVIRHVNPDRREAELDKLIDALVKEAEDRK
jgi:hypothetical protein